MDKLSEIMAAKRQEVAAHVRTVQDEELSIHASKQLLGPSFSQALSPQGQLGVLAEIKRKSPSAGLIEDLDDPSDRAHTYAEAGANALSVLTDTPYFGGSLQDLKAVTTSLAAQGPHLPCLRKDFMVHPIKVLEAVETGARAILIIVRALKDEDINAIYRAASLAGLESLFEIHDERDLERALNAGAKIIGINNRDLRTFTTNLAISETLLPKIPKDILKISESGIWTAEDARRVRDAGAQAVLVGEALMRAATDKDALQALVKAFQMA